MPRLHRGGKPGRCAVRPFPTRQAIEEALGSGLALDIAALRSRLIKDEALAVSGSGRAAALAWAADDYARVYDKAKAAGNPEAYYPGVNAATLYLLAGNATAATAIAGEVLGQLAAWPAERKSYYEVASELEAQLILGALDGARESARAVRAHIRDRALADYRGLSSTVRQLRLIIDHKGLGPEWREALAPPRVVHFLGHIIAPSGKPGRFPAAQEGQIKIEIAEALAARDIGFGYGSRAAGADILIAGALLERGASLHVVLPFDREEFVEVSVRPAGEAWVDRFNACIERAAMLHFATEDHYLGDDHLFAYCSRVAMGWRYCGPDTSRPMSSRSPSGTAPLSPGRPAPRRMSSIGGAPARRSTSSRSAPAIGPPKPRPCRCGHWNGAPAPCCSATFTPSAS